MSVSSQIYFCSIIYGETILVSHQTKPENFAELVTSLRRLVPTASGERKITFSAEPFQVHILVDDRGLVYCCIGDTSSSNLVSFTFLDTVKTKFTLENSVNNEYLDTSYNNLGNNFLPTLISLMVDFNEGRGDKFSLIDSQIRDVKKVLLKNVDLLVERGEKLEDIMAKSENLAHTSRDFRQSSRRLLRQEKCKNWKMWIFIAFSLAVILTIAGLIAAGIIKL